MPQPADFPGYGRRGIRHAPDPNLRVGDSERNQVAEALSQHFSQGRLDQSELKERLDQAMGAKTRADLAGLLTDLPPLTPPEASPARHRRGTMWILLAVVVIAASFPWQHLPWPWIPRVPWLLVGIALLLVWRRARHRHQSQVGP
jgi:hypothetical protein